MVPQTTLDWLMLQNGFDAAGTKMQEQTSRPWPNMSAAIHTDFRLADKKIEDTRQLLATAVGRR